jgi:hypothetical protein
MIVLALLLAMQADWWTALPAMGWTRVGVSEDTALFIRPGPRPNLRWERQELRETENGVRSSMSLIEVDCPGGRSRSIQNTYYSQPNLAGPASFTDGETTRWRYASPDTIGARFFDAACP